MVAAKVLSGQIADYKSKQDFVPHSMCDMRKRKELHMNSFFGFTFYFEMILDSQDVAKIT